jgi:hypothetical protein
VDFVLPEEVKEDTEETKKNKTQTENDQNRLIGSFLPHTIENEKCSSSKIARCTLLFKWSKK